MMAWKKTFFLDKNGTDIRPMNEKIITISH